MTQEILERANGLNELIQQCNQCKMSLDEGTGWLERGADLIGLKITLEIRSGYGDENRDATVNIPLCLANKYIKQMYNDIRQLQKECYEEFQKL